MSNTYQLLVDTTVSVESANVTAREILAGLVARGMLDWATDRVDASLICITTQRTNLSGICNSVALSL